MLWCLLRQRTWDQAAHTHSPGLLPQTQQPRASRPPPHRDLSPTFPQTHSVHTSLGAHTVSPEFVFVFLLSLLVHGCLPPVPLVIYIYFCFQKLKVLVLSLALIWEPTLVPDSPELQPGATQPVLGWPLSYPVPTFLCPQSRLKESWRTEIKRFSGSDASPTP